MPSGMGSAWSSATAMGAVQPLHHCTDIMGHELTHGVTEKEAQLIYLYQSGALNESVSDVYGSLVKQYYKGKQAAEDADWLIGEGIWADPDKALRSMKDPGSAFEGDLQPGHMDDFVNTIDDNGGVHINSGIPNKAFYLAATEMGGYAGRELVSYGMQRCVIPG